MRRRRLAVVAAVVAATLLVASCSAFEGPEVTPATAAPTAVLVTPTPEPSPTSTPEPPTPEPTPEPTLSINKTIDYTSVTSVGRLIELTLKVRNPGPLKAGKLSVQVEATGYAIETRTPIVGCRPDCRTATGAEGIVYVEWTAPAVGKTTSYTVQLRAKKSGTYRLEVRAYRGPAGDPLDRLATWNITVRVR